MTDKYAVLNLRTLLDKESGLYLGEEVVKDRLLSVFSCPKNFDVERFLKNGAIPSTLKKQSATYLVVADVLGRIVGYFTLAARPLSIAAEKIPNRRTRDRIERVSVFDSDNEVYTTSAYLIAQLGKNFRLEKNYQIPGKALLELATLTIESIQYTLGGLVTFLECEDNHFLMNFYEKHEYIWFGSRVTETTAHSESHILHQYFKLV